MEDHGGAGGGGGGGHRKAAPAKKPGPAPAKKKPVKSAASNTKAAESNFRMAEMFVKSGKKDKAIERLKLILKKYPDTPTAAKARTRLKELGQ